MQSDHFSEYLHPELTKAGYMGIYKKKTTEIFTGSAYTIDGCATFFRQARFHLVKKYEVEFNKAAISLADQMTNPHQKKATMNRLLKVGAQRDGRVTASKRIGKVCWPLLPPMLKKNVAKAKQILSNGLGFPTG